MNIDKDLNGTCHLICTIDESQFYSGKKRTKNNCIQLNIPITFTEVSSVAQGINQIYLQKASLENSEELQILTKVQAYPYSHNSNTARPKIDYPVLFQNIDGNDNNPLSFEMCLSRSMNSGDTILNDDELLNYFDGKNIELIVSFKLINQSNLILKIQVIPHLKSNLLEVISIEKENRSRTTTTNFFLMFLLLFIGAFWCYYLNRDLYLKESVIDEVQFFILGSVLTFFGLSTTHIKSWYRTFANFKGFFKFPEFHLPLNTLHAFRSKVTFFLFVSMLGVSCFLIWSEWSVSLPVLPSKEFKIYDSIDTHFLSPDIKRVYFKDVTKGNRFYVLLDGHQNNPNIDQDYYIGSISPEKGYMGYFKASYVNIPKNLIIPLRGDPITFDIVNIDEINVDSETKVSIRKILQGKQINGFEINGNNIVLESPTG